MADRRTLLEDLGMVRLYKFANRFAWRVRQQFSSLVHRPARAESSLVVHVRSAPAVSMRVESVDTRAATIIVSRGTSLALPPCQLPRHLEKKFTKPSFEFSTHHARAPELTSLKAETFPLFTAFPAELRVLIWQNIAAFERVVEIQYVDHTQGFRNSASPRPPAILHVCRESRFEGLKVYNLCLGRPKSIYLNLRTDILFFRVAEPSQIWQLILRPNRIWREQLRFVRRIAFTYIEPSTLRFMKKTVCSFPNLEELIILWAEDAHTRSLAGRAVNYIEQIPCPLANKGYSSRRSALRWKRKIEREFWWKNVKPEPPIISVRHWCMRDETEW